MILPKSAQICLVVLQKIPAILSVAGSTMIISSFLRSNKNRRNTQQRIVAAMSCIDLCASFTWLTTNLWIPRSYPDFPLTVGNDLTCNIQGFILQANTSSILYNGCLSIYYLLVIKFNWKGRKVEKIEILFHVVCVSFGIISASVATSLNLMNPANWNCWISPDFATIPDPNRKLAKILQWTIFYIPLWISIALSAGCMIMIYLYVRNTEIRSMRYQSTRSGPSGNGSYRLKRTREVALQGKLFVGAFVLTWLFPSAARFIQLIGKKAPNWLIVCAGTFVPSQGFFNAIVHFRLQFEKQIIDDPSKTKCRIILDIIQANMFPFCKSDGLPLQDNRHNSEPCLDSDENALRDVSKLTDVSDGRGSKDHFKSLTWGGKRKASASLRQEEHENKPSLNNPTHCGDRVPPEGNAELCLGLRQESMENTTLPPKTWNDTMIKEVPLKCFRRMSNNHLSWRRSRKEESDLTSDLGAHDWRSLKARGVNVIKAPPTKYHSSDETKALKVSGVNVVKETESFEADTKSVLSTRDEFDNTKTTSSSLRTLDTGQIGSMMVDTES